MISPRASLVFAASERDIIKLMFTRSVRRTDDRDLFRAYRSNSGNGDVETVLNYELRYERQHTDSFWSAFSAYYNDYDVVSFNSSAVSLQSESLGRLRFYGLELEARYIADSTPVTLSHNYTKHLDFDLSRPSTAQNLTASVYGYGNELANWSNHGTKLTVEQDLHDRWTATAALNVYWGYPGAEDLAAYNDATFAVGSGTWFGLPSDAGGASKAFGNNAYLNMGLSIAPRARPHSD